MAGTPKNPSSPDTIVRALLRALEKANLQALSATGACLIAIPGDPTPRCSRLTEEQCKEIGGVFVVGDCSQFPEEAKLS
jgi:hypothetical protein